jgi:hypothetical protein
MSRNSRAAITGHRASSAEQREMIRRSSELAAAIREQQEDHERERDCGICGGALRILGVLGELVHYRCEACGADHSGDSITATRAAIARAIERGV